MSAAKLKFDDLLSSGPAILPLTRAALQPRAEACAIQTQGASTLFPQSRHSEAALAGLLLRCGCWEESHTVSQDVNSPEGSYWHAIVHRMEPDSANASYWFRRVGNHPIFPKLLAAAEQILANNAPKHWRLKASWDPFLFLKWYDEAIATGGPAEAIAASIQMSEWQLLFDFCTAK